MPMGAVQLKPGVDLQKTLSDNEAGVSQAQLIRYREGLIEAYGGWSAYVSFIAGSTIREIHPWQDVAGVKHLAMGGTSNLSIITTGSNNDITPQKATSNSSVRTFTISSGSSIVSVTDNGSSGLPSIYNTAFFNTPIAIGNIFISGPYKILTVTSSITYTIGSTGTATTTLTSQGTLPTLASSANSAFVTVALSNNNYLQVVGLFYPFFAATTVGGITIQGPYQVSSIIDTTSFNISATNLASGSDSQLMNGGQMQVVYYVTQGPQPTGSGFGSGGFGSGGFGTGATNTQVSGTPITTTDWTMDNWGEVLLACPKDGPIYAWSPDSGLFTAQVVPTAPFFNGGIFVAMPQQMLVCWRSVQTTGTQNNLIVRWSNVEDYTNFTESNQTTAGSFQIPTGSQIIAGIQGPTQGVILTDVDAWVMRYIGGDLVFNFTRVGSGCGGVGPHCISSISGNVYWMGIDGFYVMSDRGVMPLPCSVWDFVFQNINRTYITKVRCATNSAFNEVMWLFPAGTATENNAYVKFNISEGEWDNGYMDRTAWTDVSILGQPIGVDSAGNIFQHETGNITSGSAAPSFQSGWFAISEGNEFSTVKFVIPDFKWGTYGGAQTSTVNVTFYVADYPQDTPKTFGPFPLTSATQYINLNQRGRLMSILVQGDGLSFWRLGKIRFRFATSGRR